MRSTPAEQLLPSIRPAPADGRVRVGPLVNLPALLQDLGADPATMFAGAGLDPQLFDDPDSELDFVAGSRLLADCVAATDCDHLGLLLGQRATPSLLGLPGFMLHTAPDVGSALGALVQHLDLHDRGAVATLSRDDRVAFLGYAIHLSGVDAADQIYDLAMTVVCGIMRALCGEHWVPSEVLLSRQAPSDPTPYRRFFGAPLRFDADYNALVFLSQWLKHPIAGADPLLHRHLEQEADALHSRQPQDLAGQVRALLHTGLGDGRGSVEHIAGLLDLHPRSLHRRLRAAGTSFREQLETVRRDLACQLLADSSMPLAQVAASLNYADATAFSRAFKRWTGLTPSRWRANRRQH